MTISLNRLGRLAKLPRTSVSDVATRIEHLPRLGQWLGHPQLYAKRDDSNGLSLGGNKVRQLEYYFGDALEKKADTILITGAIQSNFARLAAAFSAKLGMECHIQHEDRVPNATKTYRASGNVLLQRLLGAHLHYYEHGEDESGADKALHELAAKLRQNGRKPYVIPLAPGHPPLGALGYVLAAAEILQQLDALDILIDEVIVASGSGNTHAGLLFGMRALDSDIRVLGICVRRAKTLQFSRIRDRCLEIAELLEMDSPVGDDDIHLTDTHLAPGYGKAPNAVMEAIAIAARTEALLADPTYTGKAMAAFIARASELAPDGALMFMHTGGTPSLFAYQDEIARYLESRDA